MDAVILSCGMAYAKMDGLLLWPAFTRTILSLSGEIE
jgi:hypothetical protein